MVGGLSTSTARAASPARPSRRCRPCRRPTRARPGQRGALDDVAVIGHLRYDRTERTPSPAAHPRRRAHGGAAATPAASPRKYTVLGQVRPAAAQPDDNGTGGDRACQVAHGVGGSSRPLRRSSSPAARASPGEATSRQSGPAPAQPLDPKPAQRRLAAGRLAPSSGRRQGQPGGLVHRDAAASTRDGF